MATSAIYGEFCLLRMWVTDQYYDVMCGTDTTYTCTREMIEKTGPTSGGVRQRVKRIEDHQSTVSGLTKAANDTSLTFFYMLQTGATGGLQLFQQVFQDVDGNFVSLTGNALIGTQSINGPVTDFSNCSIEIFWDDIPEMDIIPPPAPDPPGVTDFIDIPVVEDEISVQDNVLIGKTVLQVRRNGLSQTVTTGTPGNQEYRFTSGTGVVETDVNVPYVAGEQDIYVLYR